jgi:tetratricopeptide (TPR) repeat protein
MQRALEEMQWGQSLEIRKSIETDADEYGILYASLAGYDISSIISPSNGFISDYYRAARMNIYGDRLNNSVEERLKAVNRRLGEIVEHLDLFDFGVRLYAIGRHEAAIELLRKFASQYPSREVFNNLGLCYYQKAFLAYTKWKQNERDQDYHFMYRVCMPLDPVPRLEALRRQMATNPRQVFQDAVAKAIENFQEAVTRDPDYETALNNLGCAHLLKGELDFAKGNFKKANAQNPYCKEAYNNLGVAYCTENNWSLAMTHFLAALSQQADFLEPIFNLGVLSQQTGQIAKAKEYFEKYLQLDGTSIYADAARKKLGLVAPRQPLTKTATKLKRATLAATSGLQPGRWNQFLTPAAMISILHAAGQDTQYFQFESKSSNEKIAILLTTAGLPGVAADGVGIGAPENLLDEKYPYPYTVKPTTKGIFRTYESLGLVFEIRNHKVHSWYLYEVM